MDVGGSRIKDLVVQLTIIVVLGSLSLVVSFPAVADGQWTALTAYHSGYKDVSIDPDRGTGGFDPSLDIEWAVRLQSFFNVTLNYSKFMVPEDALKDNTPLRAWGVGMKIDLPDYFLIGDTTTFGGTFGEPREAKQYPLNTFLSMTFYRTKSELASGDKTYPMTPRMSLGIDLFLGNKKVYASSRYGAYVHIGNTYSFFSGGLGFTF